MNTGSPTAKREPLPPKAPSLRKEKDDGGPAFPLSWEGKEEKTKKIWQMSNQGMSLRDWFAGMAIMGKVPEHAPHNAGGDVLIEQLSEQAYRLADAMIEEREKGGGA